MMVYSMQITENSLIHNLHFLSLNEMNKLFYSKLYSNIHIQELTDSNNIVLQKV
jgi:hypothetical protein